MHKGSNLSKRFWIEFDFYDTFSSQCSHFQPIGILSISQLALLYRLVLKKKKPRQSNTQVLCSHFIAVVLFLKNYNDFKLNCFHWTLSKTWTVLSVFVLEWTSASTQLCVIQKHQFQCKGRSPPSVLHGIICWSMQPCHKAIFCKFCIFFLQLCDS